MQQRQVTCSLLTSTSPFAIVRYIVGFSLIQIVRGVCNFLGSVLLQQKFEAMDGPVLPPSDGPVLQLRVTAQFI